MQALFNLILRVGPGMSPILILGESGTGKELVARAIHENGSRREKPFVPVDCGSLTPTLVESELFGYVKGAFTGAAQDKPGLLRVADGGTLFLDEIGELPIDLQVKLLRVLQEREITPVGGTKSRPIDVRIVAATNRDLDEEIREGRFRQDLFYRLNVIAIRIPPLRLRKSDIPLLLNYFLKIHCIPGDSIKKFSSQAQERLIAYDWPGNVRELQNIVQRAVALGDSPVLDSPELPSGRDCADAVISQRVEPRQGVVPLRELEKQAILNALRLFGGKKLRAAQMLGIGKTTLYRKLREYGLEASFGMLQ
jgi:two-component system response regulator HydG